MATHIYIHPQGFSASASVGGERHRIRHGDEVDFGPDDIDNERDKDRVGKRLVALTDYTGRLRDYTDDINDPAPPKPAPKPTAPEWARMSVADLADLGSGYGSFSKSGLVALCDFAGLDATGTAGDLIERLEESIEQFDPDIAR